MQIDIKVPTMGESISEAVVSNILKSTGSYVKEEEEILELETDKVNQVLHAPKSGTLTLSVKVEEVVKVGQVIGSIDTAAKAPIDSPEPKKTAPPPPKRAETPPPKIEEGPSARKMAADFLSEIKEGPTPPPPSKKVVQEGSFVRKKMSSLRKVIAERLVEAKNSTAMLTTFNEIDMSTIIDIRTREKELFQQRYGVKLGFMSFFVKAVVSALKAFPQINSFLDKEEIVTWKSYDIGVAISTDKGLIVPVVRGCDNLTFAQIESCIEQFAKSARASTLSIEDIRGGSFTITNGGTFGSLLSTPILNLPQSAILGMHAIVKRPVAIDDQVVIRPMMYVALSYDHRIIDGREAVSFLVHIKQTLEDPNRILLDS
jgi:2-oxoglutarate dehydrogenase E2 component (dihydrolipoamide succinyltransferase)